MKHICWVDVLKSSQYLVEEVAHVVITKLLGFQQFVHVCFHQALHNVAELMQVKVSNENRNSVTKQNNMKKRSNSNNF